MGMVIKALTPVAVAAAATAMTLGHQTNLMETRIAYLFLHRGPATKGQNARVEVLTGQMVQVDLGDREVQEAPEIPVVQVRELKH